VTTEQGWLLGCGHSPEEVRRQMVTAPWSIVLCVSESVKIIVLIGQYNTVLASSNATQVGKNKQLLIDGYCGLFL
jgi:hypothetical protein